MELLIAFMIFASVVALGLAVANLFGHAPERERLSRLANAKRGGGGDGGGLLNREDFGWFERLIRSFAGRSARERTSAVTATRQRLIYAGFRSDTAFATYQGSRVVCGLAFPLLFLLSPLSWSMGHVEVVVSACAAAAFGLVVPSAWLDRQVTNRQKALQLALPDALDLMVVCVEAGLGINASLKRVAEDFERAHPVMSAEFKLVNFETRAGRRTTEALRSFADRTGVSEVSTLVAMLIQTERFGTGLADTLRVHADAMRLRRLQRAEEQANKAPVRMMFPTMFIFVAMLIIVVGPGFLKLGQYFSANG